MPISPEEILHKYWGYNQFRPLQKDIISSVMNQKDTLALLATGGGKSICYQIPALIKDGICIVVSPLIALMYDQVEDLTSKGIRAINLSGGMGNRETDILLDNCLYGDYKFLFVSPEKLENKLVQARIQKMNVNLIAVDEAHCISQWGYDFRPSYLTIKNIRELIPEAPVLALTATATTEVINDITKELNFKKEHAVLKSSFARSNLSYSVLEEEDKLKRLESVLNKVKGSSVIYVRNRRRTKEIATHLVKKNISADFYHAGLTSSERQQKQTNWIKDKCRVMVATNAFGMGINKPNVRSVIHIDLPDSPEAYFQEAGRAGRDEKKAFALLLYSKADVVNIKKQKINTEVDKKNIVDTYNKLCNYLQMPIGSGEGSYFYFDIRKFSDNYNLQAQQVYSVLLILQEEGYISLSENFNNKSKLLFTVNKSDLYSFQLNNPSLDTFTKTLLRMYGGVFDNYVNITEKDIATKTGSSAIEVVKKLNLLNRLKVISYLPVEDLPILTFLKERFESGNLKLDTKKINQRIERSKRRIEWMIKYAGNTEQCRTILLCNYFGEKVKQPCGVCDVCIINKQQLTNDEFLEIKKHILKAIKKEKLDLPLLLSGMNNFKEKKVVHVYRWMLDHDELRLKNNCIVTNEK